MTTAPQAADRSPARRAFTLTELMVVMTIVGVMAAMSLPSFQRAIEQSRADIAVANLRAIWAAERLYWLEYHTYISNVGTLQTLGVLDNTIPTNTTDSMGGYKYAITEATETTMKAKVTHASDFGSFEIDQSGNVTGSITINGIVINAGFQ
jgi:prepilin-type N-terminal cleavage/methylation domain-containing protein